MPFDHDVLANVEATLDGLSSPTPEQAYDALLQYDAPMVASAAARRALAGGGGGGSIPSGNGSPNGSVVPSGIGALYTDSTNGGLYIAVGVTDADWVAVGGKAASTAVGQRLSNTEDAVLQAAANHTSSLTDVASAGSTGNGVYWDGAAGSAYVETGPAGEFVGTLQDAAGNMTVPGTVTAAGFVGGSLPAEWTIGPDAVNTALGGGGLSILLTESGRALELLGKDPLDHVFYVDLDSNPKFGLQMVTGAEFRVENDGSTYLYGRDDGSSNPWLWFYRDDGAGGKRVTIDFRSDAVNRFTLFDDAGNAVYQARTDGSVHVKTGAATAMVADL